MSKNNYNFSPTYSDNPYIDILVNYVKILGANAVIKNENQALQYEDARSVTSAAKYIKYIGGAWDDIYDGEYNPDEYFEYNSYYRMLNGLPPAYSQNDENAYLKATGYDDDEAYETTENGTQVISELYRRYFIDMSPYGKEYEGKFLHELTNDELTVISNDGGILDQIKQEYGSDSHYQYIYHLGDKRVDYYTARKATNFALLYIPKLNKYDIVEQKFKRYFDRNRRYTEATIYSEAYKFMSYHYDNFMQMLIIIQTMVDIISEVQEYIINKDVLDSRTIRYLFESYGITYYKEIPTTYQIRIIKNVNKLIKYKSSNQNIMDILELFDDDSISVFTYYLMKTKKLNRDEFFYYTEQDLNPYYISKRRFVYLGQPVDIENNKVPIMFTNYNEDSTAPTYDSKGNIIKENFIKTHLYNYKLIDGSRPDVYSNRNINDVYKQPIASKLAESDESFILDFLDNIAIFGTNKLPWFGMERYNKNPELFEDRSYLNERNAYMNKLKLAYNSYISSSLYDSGIPLNKYNFRQIKYYVYGLLGIFDYDKTIDFETTQDVDLESRFYTVDSLITEEYCDKHGVSYEEYQYFIQSEDRFILNHTIPFMVWNEYKKNTPYSVTNSDELYLFGTDKYIDATHSKLGDMYAKYTQIFREHYVTFIRMIVEALFADMEFDAVNNPSPRYDGWIDTGIASSLTHLSINDFKFNTQILVKEKDKVLIYTTAYVYEEVTEDMIGTEIFRKNYDLCFLKVPILDSNAYSVMENREARRNYDTVTLNDPFWDGVSTYDLLTDEERDKIHQAKKQEILGKEFNIERTKYMVVDADIDLVKSSYQISYFMNMLYDKFKDEETLMVEVNPEVSEEKVKLNDLLTFAIALNFIYNGTEPDNIASDMEKNMYINGFNFESDWNTIYNYLENKHFIGNNYRNQIHEYTYTDENGNTINNTGYGMDPFKRGWMSELYDDAVFYGRAYYPPEGRYIDVKTYFGQKIFGYDENENPIFPFDNDSVVVDFITIESEDSELGDISFPTYVYIESDDTIVFTDDPEGRDPGEYSTLKINSSGDVTIYDKEANKPINSRIPNPDRTVIPDTKVGAFLSGRYEKTDASTERIDYNESEIWNYNLKHHLVITPKDATIMDITWDNPYPDNNSHGLWLDTGILTAMENASDLEKINMLKDIYTNNTNLYNHLVYMMSHAESKRMYDTYKILFDSFMETKMNHEYYTLEDSNGNIVYTNSNNTTEQYNLVSERVYSQDENGFPIFRGTDMMSGLTAKYRFDYYSAKSSRFNSCVYYKIGDTAKRYDCLRNEKGDYIVFYNDDELKLKRDTYFFPDNAEQYFEYDYENVNYLVSKTDSKLRIRINVNDNYQPILDTTKKYVVRTNPDGTYMEDSDGYYIIVEVPVDDKRYTGKEILFTKKIADNYYDFLQFRNPSLYAHLIDLKYNYKNLQLTDSYGNTMYTPGEDKRTRIETLCEYIVEALERYFDKKEWAYMFNVIPTANIKNIQSYIIKMVTFFKSWKVQMLDATVNLAIDDPFNNKIYILDDMYFNSTYQLQDKYTPKDYKYFDVHTIWNDKLGVLDKVDIVKHKFEEYVIEYGFGEKMYGNNFDFPELTSTFKFTDKASPNDLVQFTPVTFTGEIVRDSKGNLLLP